jgi:hypothetical protein
MLGALMMQLDMTMAAFMAVTLIPVLLLPGRSSR